MTEIFVFGSNLKGIHGAGAALYAKRNYGAVYGEGVGRTGNAYAIPTKSTPYESLPVEEIGHHIANFIRYAEEHPELTFIVTPVGCGLAGYSHEDIAPWFIASPKNVVFPIQWKEIMDAIPNFWSHPGFTYHERSE